VYAATEHAASLHAAICNTCITFASHATEPLFSVLSS
jgi:hypothetical protein